MAKAEVFIQYDPGVEDAQNNIRSLRLIATALEKDNAVYINSFGYEGGDVQSGCSIKINLSHGDIYRGYINPDEWEYHFTDDEEDYDFDPEPLSRKEREISSLLQEEMENWVVFNDDDGSVLLKPEKIRLLSREEDALIFKTGGFKVEWLEKGSSIWSYLTTWE